MKNTSILNLKPEEKGTIIQINLYGKTKTRLEELGIIEGSKIQFKKYAPLGDPIEISIRGYNLAIRKELAQNIIVDKTSTEWRKV